MKGASITSVFLIVLVAEGLGQNSITLLNGFGVRLRYACNSGDVNNNILESFGTGEAPRILQANQKLLLKSFTVKDNKPFSFLCRFNVQPNPGGPWLDTNAIPVWGKKTGGRGAADVGKPKDTTVRIAQDFVSVNNNRFAWTNSPKPIIGN